MESLTHLVRRSGGRESSEEEYYGEDQGEWRIGSAARESVMPCKEDAEAKRHGDYGADHSHTPAPRHDARSFVIVVAELGADRLVGEDEERRRYPQDDRQDSQPREQQDWRETGRKREDQHERRCDRNQSDQHERQPASEPRVPA